MAYLFWKLYCLEQENFRQSGTFCEKMLFCTENVQPFRGICTRLYLPKETKIFGLTNFPQILLETPQPSLQWLAYHGRKKKLTENLTGPLFSYHPVHCSLSSNVLVNPHFRLDGLVELWSMGFLTS